MSTITIRKTSARWLEDAPDEVIDVFDHPDTYDRYTICFKKETIYRDNGQVIEYVPWVGVSDNGGFYQGDMSAWDFRAWRSKDARKHRIAWKDLPAPVRASVGLVIMEAGKFDGN